MKRSAWLPMVVSTLLFAAMGVCVKLASSRYSVAEIVGYRGLVGGGLHAHTPGGLALLLAIGALATLAQLMLTRAYAIGTVLVNASLQYLGIGWSFLFGVLLFDDPVTAAALLGMGLIVAAGLAATRLSHAADGRAAATAATGPADGPSLDLDAPTAQGANR